LPKSIFSEMAWIKVENIQVYAYHGCLEEEGKIGSDYIVDVEVEADFTKAAQSDELIDAIDYVHLNKIAVEEMAIRAKLLEHVNQRILDRIMEELPSVQKAIVSVAKINPPIGGNVDRVKVIMSEER
jgi:dihydroneopterin aldolase